MWWMLYVLVGGTYTKNLGVRLSPSRDIFKNVCYEWDIQ